ncbi:hypothetical protein EA462_09605 [Natrarchaeobius halalkaliphilus]|uniref:Uncharacterized protein n=1 Tax=Natrarchaeobius halalkaliphilus TaxID=1679091 RepID=A0A3N6NZ87_9EURY|nr:DUF6517 family protein [Natrarchaeobius halalkaliphilus]RQG90229.1 hypothetical protein EA462_09605 [Natrarchaeobius halalkaliphilus]
MNRRDVIAGIGATGIAALSGCLGVLGLDEHVSSPAGVEPSISDDTGYEQTDVDSVVVERELSLGPLTEEVVAENYLTEYEKSVEMGVLGEQRGAVFTVLSTPKVDVLGREFNPVEEMSAGELVELIESNYDDIGDVSLEDERSVSILGESTPQSRFSAEAAFDGTTVDVDLHVTEAVSAGEDLIVTIGVYPEQLRSGESDNVRALAEAVTSSLEEGEPADDDDTDDDGSSDDGGDGDDGSSDDGGDGDDDGINIGSVS